MTSARSIMALNASKGLVILINAKNIMNKETYEALKRIVKDARRKHKYLQDIKGKDIKQVESWIDEVAKEYEEEN